MPRQLNHPRWNRRPAFFARNTFSRRCPSQGQDANHLRKAPVYKKQWGVFGQYVEEFSGLDATARSEVREKGLDEKEVCPECVAVVRNIWDLHNEIIEIQGDIKGIVKNLFKDRVKSRRQMQPQVLLRRLSPPRMQESADELDSFVDVVVKEEDNESFEIEIEGFSAQDDSLEMREAEVGGVGVEEDQLDTSASPSRPVRKSRARAQEFLKKCATMESLNDKESGGAEGSQVEVEVAKNGTTSRCRYNYNISEIGGRWECNDCGVVMDDLGSIRGHCRAVHISTRNHTCQICGKCFPRPSRLQQHMKLDHSPESDDNGLVEAEEQEQKRKRSRISVRRTKQTSTKERREHDDKLDPSLYAIKKVGVQWQCLECNKILQEQRAAVWHFRRIHLQEKNFTCDICGKAFFQYCSFQAHMKHKHVDDGQGGYKEMVFNCRVCGRSLKKDRHRMIHEAIVCKVQHTPELLAQYKITLKHCTIEGCNYVCAHQSQIDDHIRRHSDEMTFSCSKCDKVFKTFSFQRLHERQVHDKATTTKRLECEECNATFNRRPALIEHMRKNHNKDPSDLNWYPKTTCKMCGRVFSSHRVAKHELNCDGTIKKKKRNRNRGLGTSKISPSDPKGNLDDQDAQLDGAVVL